MINIADPIPNFVGFDLQGALVRSDDLEGKIFSLFGIETDTAVFIVDWDKTIRWIEAPIIMELHIDRLMDAIEENCG